MYILPQTQVYQEFRQAIAQAQNPLRACIIGPNYLLRRYAEEKELIGLGAYNPDEDTAHEWPNRPAGAVVDESWVRLFFDSAWLHYWTNPDTIQLVSSSDRNKIKASVTNFQSYGSWDRAATLYDRDVQVGDGVRIRGIGSDSLSYDQESYVTGVEHEEVPSVVGAATADADNQSSTTASESINQVAGTVNAVTGVADGSAYDGLADGQVSEVYTVEVVQGSSGGSAITARLKITSASGLDNQSDVIPAAFGNPTDIGTRGLKVTFSTGGGSSSSSSLGGSSTPDDDFVVGQRWVVQVSQAYTAVSATSGGTYTGSADVGYIITVTRGGVFADQPQITVSSTTGYDSSGPHTVTGSGVAIPIGNYGVTMSFDGPLNKGDRFYVTANAATDGAVKTLVLAHTMPLALVGQDLTVDLYIIKDMEVSKNRVGHPPLVNFETSDTEITVKQGIIGTDASWTNNGATMEMNVYKGDMYVQYRALQTVDCGKVYSLDDVTLVEDTIGPVTPDCPLAFGVYKALQNSGGVEVKYVAVCSDDLAGYTEAINGLVGRNDVYSLVPLTQDQEIHSLFQAHVDSMSTPENGRWRRAICNSAAVTEQVVVNEDDSGNPVLAKVLDDPATSGTQYTLVHWTDGLFLTKGVSAGHEFRCNYSNDLFGNYTYESYIVDAVISEDTLRLVSGPASAINVDSKFEIWDQLTKDEIATAYGQLSGNFGDRRVTHIWPDVVDVDGVEVKGFYLCCAYAGLRSSVAPHRGLTNTQLVGFTDVSRSTEFFGGAQLDIMAGMGTCIITQSPDGEIYCRHQLTTGNYEDLNEREESITTNADSISAYLLSAFEPYIGRTNMTPDFINFLDSQLQASLETIKSNDVEGLGPQLLDEGTEIQELRQHTIFKDRGVARVTLGMPYPFNNFDIHLVI